MKRNSYSILAFAAVLALGLVASTLAVAADGRDCTAPVYTPSPNSVVITPRVFNDCPSSTVTTTDYYPAMIQIQDTDEGCVGWTNLHVWSFSEDGITPAVFENCSHYKFSAVFKGYASGAVAEGGLRVSPWWAQDVDGRFMARIGGNGEIACFGGRLPFYSFTAAHGITYTPGEAIWMEISYNPRSLTVADPATIGYSVFYQGNAYYSGAIPFDIYANPAEDPPHGLHGELYPTRVGGFLQGPNGNGGALFDVTGNWSNIHFEGPTATASTRSTWGQLKSIYR